MRLCFLIEKQYAPYPKWFGLAFAKLKCSREFSPIFDNVIQSENWQARDRWLSRVYEIVISKFNELSIVNIIPEQASQFYDRPFRVIWGERLSRQIVQEITDPLVKRISSRSLIGNIDLFSDNTDLLEDPQFRKALRQLYLD
jgi:hypothetical protein